MAASKTSQRPAARIPGSVTARIEALSPGESIAEAIRFVVDKGTPAAAQKWLDETGRIWTVNVNRVKKSVLGSNFTVERMTDFSHGGALLCAVVITRIA
ncbi:MAG: hypothetical protein M3N97_03635 [Pseudomonadota bacterium]|nr:hypothetical protein [Pseudomonadota bacterium]